MNPLQSLSSFPLIAYLILITSIKSSSLLPQSSHQLQETTRTEVRDKRSYSYDRSVEVFVVTDYTMSEYHRRNLRQYILTLMSTVALIFRDASIGNAINVAVVRIHVLSEGETRDIIHSSVTRTLRQFCRWQHEQTAGLRDGDPVFHDAALLITRKDLCRDAHSCDTLGLAQLGSICNSKASCAVIEDNGLSAAFTIAHELAHILSIPHDDAEKCSFPKGSQILNQNQMIAKSSSLLPEDSNHIMSRALHYNSHPWTWSPCSRQYLTDFFDDGNGECLLNQPQVNLLHNFSSNYVAGEIQSKKQTMPVVASLAGAIFDPDYQCQLVFGPESKICPYMPSCRRLWCTIGARGGCRTQHMPWADGTSCGSSKWCHKGKCVSRTAVTEDKIDGGWGEWSGFTPCSRSCGGGIQKITRECDKPRPWNGGKYCVGHRVRYKSCNTEPCNGKESDDRSRQCSSFNGQDFGIDGLSQSPIWYPHTKDMSREESCKLYCTSNGAKSYHLLRDKVIDGTPCFADSDDVCINGKCYPAGCDRVLFSRTQKDNCGVCGGNNSTCVMVKQSIRPTKLKYGYSTLLTLPVNSSNIVIEHRKIRKRFESNFLSLKDDRGRYLLNGDHVITMYPKTVLIDESGTVAEYSGSKTDRETIIIRNKLHHKIFVDILSVGTTSPLINYEYSLVKRVRKAFVPQVGGKYVSSKIMNRMI